MSRDHLAEQRGENAPALLEKEIRDGEGVAAEGGVEAAHHLGQAAPRVAVEQVLLQGGVGGRIVTEAYATRDVMTTEVGHGVERVADLPGQLRADARAADPEGGIAVGRAGFVQARDLVGVDAGLAGRRLEEAVDGIVGGEAADVRRRRPHAAAVHVGARALLRIVAHRGAQPLHERGLEVGAAQFPQILHGHRGVAEGLHGLQPGEVVEEPAAGSEHQESLALHFEQPSRLHPRVSVEGGGGLRGEEPFERRPAPAPRSRRCRRRAPPTDP